MIFRACGVMGLGGQETDDETPDLQRDGKVRYLFLRLSHAFYMTCLLLDVGRHSIQHAVVINHQDHELLVEHLR